MMQDPLPENITGSKRVAHTVQHEVNWGYVALAVAVIFVVIYFDPLSRLSMEEPVDDSEGGEEGESFSASSLES
ncbi:hypothetical protein [Haloferax volcanii]|uniref:hypothetical protein n=1 Tax=Haloferax volcanii TaxID=2246 RepID=UPI00385DEDD0